jgi:hypothetical protein
MKMWRSILTPVSMLILAVALFVDHRIPRPVPAPAPVPTPVVVPVPTVNGQVLGRAYAPLLLASYSDAWLAAARTLEAGKSVAEAEKTLQDTCKNARVRAFTEHVAPSFGLILPEGSEPSTPEKRAQVVELWREFALGLKGGQ